MSAEARFCGSNRTSNSAKDQSLPTLATTHRKEVGRAVTSTNEIVQLARAKDRPTALEFFEELFEGYQELHGDRLFADDEAITGGIAFLDKRPVTVIGIQKGRDLKENLQRNFGAPHPEGYRKALRLMKQAEKFQRPVITFINTAGAFCGIGAEERGEGESIAKNLMEMSDLKVPIIAIIIGEGGSGGALALAVADEVWMLEHAIYAILSPEGFASILWKDGSRAPEAAELMKITAGELLKMGVVDKVIPEMLRGHPIERRNLMENLRKQLSKKLSQLSQLPTETLLEQRYQRFRKY
ncbi:acetyl-CoA carboxylase carboxyl transferase subunit alpha [Enterococcus sp. 2201sp1_2201st1_B8_2201SCRN_220225]|uniref:acetyl-CoA carboxylase carboxyl transferase subunit alpha n=1 Tax=unclassified Enterococcus TaxID=2608891 RepID=UPI0034A4C629